jgi:tight adherence protein B
MSVGDGREAYREPSGQVAVAVGLALVLACWIWAGRILRLPEEQRVLAS